MAETTNALMVLFYDSLLDGITATANFTPPAGYGLANLKLPQLVDKCRTPDLTTGRSMLWDLGVAQTANAFALIGTNATESVTGRFVAADDAGLTAGVVQSGATEADVSDDSLLTLGRFVPLAGRALIYVHPETFTKRYIAWYQSDPLNAAGYQQWSVARLGLGWQPGVGFQTWKSTPLPSGPLGLRKVLRQHEFTLDFLTREEAYAIQALAMANFETRRLLVIPEPLRPNTYGIDAIWCTLGINTVKEPNLITPPEEKRWRVILTFTEVDR